MLLVACTLAIVAATSTLPPDAPPQARRLQYPSEEALRRYAQGRLLEEQGQRDQALGEYSRALLLDDRAASLARRMSEAAANGGDAARSLEFAERALKLDPHDARALWLKGAALMSLDHAHEALDALAAAAREDSEQVDYQRAMSRAADFLGQTELAVRGYRRTVWLDPYDTDSWFQLATSEARLGHFGAADTALAEVADMAPARPGLALLRGWVRENLGHPDQALALYLDHLKSHPDDQATRRRAMSLLAREKRFEEAYAAAKRMTQASPDDRELNGIEADLAFSAGHADAGVEALRRMRHRWPDDGDVLAMNVGILSRHERARDAVTEAEAWVTRHPADLRGRLTAAQARILNHEPAAARTHIDQAIAMAPDSLAPRVALAQFYDRQKQPAEAEKVW